jgi:tripartite-type tricarboxylate transporter receptor subunit TctC
MTEQQVPLVFEVWRGVGAPKGTPKEALAKLEEAFAQAAKDKAFTEAAQKFGFTVNYQTGAAFAKFLQGQDELVGRLMKKINVKK